MATGRKPSTKIERKFQLKKRDVIFDSNGWMVIKNPAIRRLIEERWMVAGVITPLNVGCPRPPGPVPPSPDGMCVCAFTLVGQEVSKVRGGQLRKGTLRAGGIRTGELRTGPGRGLGRTPNR